MISVTRQKRSLQAFLPSHQKAICMICRLFLGVLLLSFLLTASAVAHPIAPSPTPGFTLRPDEDPIMEDLASSSPVTETPLDAGREWSPMWTPAFWWLMVWRR